MPLNKINVVGGPVKAGALKQANINPARSSTHARIMKDELYCQQKFKLFSNRVFEDELWHIAIGDRAALFIL
ncbi:MAG TPA: hypothetical protein ENJ08_08835 [Gammaproteobacteria bacterium]|nr:hypothetical protein [Gammaproteobacteria bacterium]